MAIKKKVILFFSILLLVGAFTSCSEISTKIATKRLASNIEKMNKDLPQIINETTTFSKVVLEDNLVVFVYTLDEYEFKSLRRNKEEVEKYFKTKILNLIRSNSETYESMKKTHKGIACRFVGLESGDTTTFTIPAEEV